VINVNNPKLAINGGKPVSDKTIVIHKPYLGDDDREAIVKAFDSTFISGDGPECREFEKALANYVGVKHALFLNSATSALDLAFRVKGFPPGSEVIVPCFTYTSTALGALYNNLVVKLCDVHADNGNIDCSKLEALINSKTVAIAPVDYTGNPADMDEVNRIAKKHGLYVVHDTAQSLGSVYKGKRTGALADVSTFSFHGTKNITTGEGGAITTDDDAIAARIRIMREKGTDKHNFITGNITRGFYEYVDIGNSYVQSNLLGALGLSQIKKVDEVNRKRKAIADIYLHRLQGIEGLDFVNNTKSVITNWHIFGILVPPEHKFWVMDALRAEGIYANVHYNPLHQNTLYKSYGTDADFPGAVTFFNRLLRLPLYPGLQDEEVDLVCKAVRKVFTGKTD